jgi:hypothetical protein
MSILATLAETLQQVLGPSLDQLGCDTGLIQRERKFSGASLLKTIVLTVMKAGQPTPMDYLKTASLLGVHVTQRALGKRFTSKLVTFLRHVLEELLEHSLEAAPAAVPLLMKFTVVFVGDSTTIALPDEYAEEFSGCGGKSGSGKASMKIQVLWNLTTGKLTKFLWEPGRQHDSQSVALEESPPAGSMTIYDLAYFDLKRFRKWTNDGAFWISRLQTGTVTCRDDGLAFHLLDHLKRHASDGRLDEWIVLGAEERLKCRVIALRVPERIAAQRRRKAYKQAQKHGLTPSERHLAWCDWTVFVTNCPEDLLTWKEVVVLYRSRWQIELMFKLWKSHNKLASYRTGASSAQRMAELWAKMIGVILQHWILLKTSWPQVRRSLWTAAGLIRDRLTILIDALDDLGRLIKKLEELAVAITEIAKVGTRKKEPTWFQLLLNPELLTW